MDIIERSWRVQNRFDERIKRIGKGRYGRVLKMAKKPEPEDYKRTLQITSVGCALIGGLGFCIYLIWEYAPDLFRGLLGV